MIKIAIVIPTYKRSDGRTYSFLHRCLKSIQYQTYKNYKVFLIGDKYEDNDEFIELSSLIDKDKIYFENLPYAKERDVYINDSDKLWCSGGVNAINYGIEKALSEGFEFICHMDHDDYWTETHLIKMVYAIMKDPDCVFLCSKCNYINSYIVPKWSKSGQFYPTPGDMTHSATCVNFNKIPIRYRDVFAEDGHSYPADADIFNKIREYMISNNLRGYLLDDVTCIFDKIERS